MTAAEISKRRLENQLLFASDCKSLTEVVSRMGAVQGQDYKMAKLAVASRFENGKSDQVATAVDQGKIIRTHIMRPTWHLVAAEDIYWLLDLTATQVQRHLKTRQKQLGITEQHLKKSASVLEKALADHQYLTRDEIYKLYAQAKIPIDTNRGYHLLFWAEQMGLICSGATKDRKITYALLEERVQKKVSLSEEEALHKLAKKYFNSHGPASLYDFAWWSGLSMSKSRRALDSIQSEMSVLDFEDKEYWFFERSAISSSKAHLLPAYDEFLIGYKDKSLSLPFPEHRKKVHHIGTFRPFVVVDGVICGVWKILSKKENILQVEFFKRLSKAQKSAFDSAVQRLEKTLGKSLVLSGI